MYYLGLDKDYGDDVMLHIPFYSAKRLKCKPV